MLKEHDESKVNALHFEISEIISSELFRNPKLYLRKGLINRKFYQWRMVRREKNVAVGTGREVKCLPLHTSWPVGYAGGTNLAKPVNFCSMHM